MGGGLQCVTDRDKAGLVGGEPGFGRPCRRSCSGYPENFIRVYRLPVFGTEVSGLDLHHRLTAMNSNAPVF